MSDPQDLEVIETVALSDKQMAARKRRNVAIALGLAALVVIFYASTVVKFGPKLMDRPIINIGTK